MAQDTWSPLKLASERGYMGVAKVLLDHGANVNVSNNLHRHHICPLAAKLLPSLVYELSM